MALLKITSPHAHSPGSTGDVMRLVLLALVPGFAVQSYFFGWGVAFNLILAASFALGLEAAVMKLRRRPVGFYLRDCTALVTATLVALAIPPYSPFWLILVGMIFAIVIGKQLYGGMGFNPFNPAMVAYVVLLISFPVEMTRWFNPSALGELPGFMDGLRLSLPFFGSAEVDAYTGATALDLVRQNQSLLWGQLAEKEAILGEGRFASVGWEWVNLAYLLGGLFLLYRRVFTWHAPLSMLLALSVISLLFWDPDSASNNGSPLFHLFSGATMLGAFFIVTDPVTSAVSKRGRIIYGAAIGLLVYTIRTTGNYPDALAFSVLLLNFAAPFIDFYTVPRTYGHHKARHATEKVE